MAVQDSCVSAMHTIHEPNKQVFVNLTQPKELASSETELLIRVRKPYTISKQREKWTEEEHEKFLEAIKLHGRSWCRIQEHVGTKTTIQIRSHAQKFFSKVDREINTGNSIEIPPPRPKRKPLHPYPRKLGQLYTIQIPDRKQLENSSPIPSFSEQETGSPIPSFSEQESGSPISVLSVVGSDASGSSFIKPPNGSISPSSSFAGSDRLNVSLSESENGYCTPTSSNVGDNKILSLGLVPNTSTKLDESALELRLDSKDHTPPSEGSLVEAQPTSVKLFGRTVYITNSQKTRPFDDENIATQCLKPVPSAEVCPHEEKTEQSPAHEALCGVPSRISCNGAASSIYYLLVPNDVQMGSKSEMFAPVPFLTSFQGILPFTSTNINMTSGYYKHQTRIGDPIQFSPKEDSSSGSNSCSSSNNIIINDDNNHSAVSHEGSGLQHEPLCSFKLKRSENSAFSRVKKASTGRSARGFSPYRRNGDS